jgi:hypothetical protein
MEAARRAGRPIKISWLVNQERYKKLIAQTREEINAFAKFATDAVKKEQAAAVAAGEAHAAELMLGSMSKTGRAPVGWSFARIHSGALADLEGQLKNGSPVSSLFKGYGAQAADEAREVLREGVAFGRSPRVTARKLRESMAGNLHRALAISRTTTIDSYRRSQHEAYRANDDVVKGWIWHAQLDDRTCAACWAMHGTEHSNSEWLDDHVNGRCAPVPITVSFRDLGFDIDEPPSTTIEKGPDVFARLSASDQVAILGPLKLEALNEGSVEWPEFVGRSFDPDWGTMRFEQSMKKIRARQAAA